MDDFLTCRIPVKGRYLGYDCPKDNIRITRSSYYLLKRIGIPIETYNPYKVEKPKQETKQTDDKTSEVVVIDEFDVNGQIVDNACIEGKVSDENNFNIEDLSEYVISDEDLELDAILKETEETEVSTFESVNVQNTQTVDAQKVWTIEELDKITRSEMTTILCMRGHTGGKDPYAVKQKDKKNHIIQKILDTNPIE